MTVTPGGGKQMKRDQEATSACSVEKVTQTEPSELKENQQGGQLESPRSHAEVKFQILHEAPLEYLGI